MGNTGSNARERHKSCDSDSLSREIPGQALVLDKNAELGTQNAIHEDDVCDKKTVSTNFLMTRAYFERIYPKCRLSSCRIDLRHNVMERPARVFRASKKMVFCRQFSNGKAAVRTFTLAEHFRNGNPFRWLKGNRRRYMYL